MLAMPPFLKSLEITAAEKAAQGVPDDLTVYGVFTASNFSKTAVTDDVTGDDKQVSLDVFYDIDGDSNTTVDIHTIDLVIFDVV